MKPKKILFANFPADGHFNPLTGLAVHLKNAGHDVRWYTGRAYEPKISKLGIPYYPMRKALDISGRDMAEVFPEREKHRSQTAKLKFDLAHVFILRAPELYEDIRDINREFPFDLMIADIVFTGIPFVREKLNKPVVAIGVLPIAETSRDLPPAGLGLTPSATFFGRCRQALMRQVADKVIFREPDRLLRKVFDEHGIRQESGNLFDVLYKKSSLVLQSGTPGFEYQRSDLSSNIRFVGPLLPHSKVQSTEVNFRERIRRYRKVILVTQGTVETDPEKIIVPTLEAYKDSDCLVIATTGGSKTQELRARYPQSNILIEDFIPFQAVMPYADVYVTNGGYGGVMLGIEHKLPLVVGGIHEGKNEINARIGYFRLGINLGTETPGAGQMKKAIDEVLSNPVYKDNVRKLSAEFARYNPNLLCERYIAQLLGEGESWKKSGEPALTMYE